ncbi:hypothetical protein B4147_0247 [Bacillus wiedmannii]|uniref:Uncharacterized protein n=1 Tax=Bacillus wiedmannii TaxID=1890302 RepID=A0A0G8BUY0_9BACI|nr:hypothetical protein B4147_0247 [Bacillus wiedmannii]
MHDKKLSAAKVKYVVIVLPLKRLISDMTCFNITKAITQ